MIVDSRGTQFLEVRPMAEAKIEHLNPEFAVTLVKHAETFLLVFDRWKNHWEVPGGAIDPGETVRGCAIRELWEESGQTASYLTFNGGIHIKTADGSYIWGAVFSGIVDQVQPFTANDEIGAIKFWNQNSPLDINPIDRALLDYFAVHKS